MKYFCSVRCALIGVPFGNVAATSMIGVQSGSQLLQAFASSLPIHTFAFTRASQHIDWQDSITILSQARFYEHVLGCFDSLQTHKFVPG